MAKDTIAPTPPTAQEIADTTMIEQFVEEAFEGDEANPEQIANELQSLAFAIGDYTDRTADVPPYVAHVWKDHLTVLAARVRLIAPEKAEVA